MAKGSNFEREICKQLSLWWTENERDDIFWRTAGSGARATVRRKAGKGTANQEGDICATDPIGQPLIWFTTIELKVGYNDWTIKEIIDSRKKNKTLEAFWDQCIRERENIGCPAWWLITRQDRREKLLFFNDGFYNVYRKVANPPCPQAIRVLWRDQHIHCINFEAFLIAVNPKKLLEIIGK